MTPTDIIKEINNLDIEMPPHIQEAINTVMEGDNIKKTHLTPIDILTVTHEYYNVEYKANKFKDRHREYINARMVGFYIIRTYTKMTLKGIAALCEKDHTSVLHSVKLVQALIETNKAFRAEVEDIESILTSIAVEKQKENRVLIGG